MGRTQHIARAALLLSALAALSCAMRTRAEPDPAADPKRAAPLSAALSQASREVPRPPGALVVRLAFGAGADLDLYVTDTQRETVYFANSPSRSGGRLDRDRTCADAAPRVETVIFEHPAPGHYRVGVDYPKSCDGHDDPALYTLVTEHDGWVHLGNGEAAAGRFAPVVLEFDLP
jgi:hypothetical protein